MLAVGWLVPEQTFVGVDLETQEGVENAKNTENAVSETIFNLTEEEHTCLTYDPFRLLQWPS